MHEKLQHKWSSGKLAGGRFCVFVAVMNDSTQNVARRRLYLLIAFFAFWLCAISARLVWLQVVRFGDLTLHAAHMHERNVDLAPQRGIIYDRNGQEMAMTVNVDSVFAVPAEIPDQASTASVLSKILKIQVGLPSRDNLRLYKVGPT